MTEIKPFSNYLKEVQKQYKYTVKFALNEITDELIDQLENSLQKYKLVSASPFRCTPIQENPLDFPNVKNSCVHSCDLVLEYPASLDFLRTFIGNSTGTPHTFIAVYSENDPRQIETDLFLDRNSPEFKKNYKTKLGSDYDPEPTPKYGDKYNMDFLKELEKVRKERATLEIENPLSIKPVIDHSNLPDGFNDLPKVNTTGFFGRMKPKFKV